ncbi:outer membrane protein assembly factor BamA [Tichowtungia aerotolerans]|uniref:Outer membrane protein assembly factor BamA n=1 Tax=Tichowtungia aerotolerans TaxID=2697043 RepID=A0A6P1M1P9_9BACT|nr:outer membrane protein assembly factor BamA [Tichowtungia aerotolerans]QHI68510.1 outer membrane protein assembly factor BamA [Tichowtungia aerotolerans]
MTKKTCRFVRLFVGGMLLSSAGWAAVTIDDIRIENPEKVELDASFVRAYTSLQAGQAVDNEDQLNTAVAKDVDNLRRSGRFSYVRAFIEQDDGRLTLVYSVVPRFRLRKIEVVGAKKISSRKLKNQLELNLGDYVDDAIVGEKVHKLEAYCREHKYPDAAATWNLTPDEETGAADLQVSVDEGEKLRVKKITLEGDRFLSDSFAAKTGRFFKRLVPSLGSSSKEDAWFVSNEVRSQLNQKETFWITPWFGAYRPELVDADLAVLQKFYMDKGFLDVSVEAPEVDSHGRGRLELTYRISEGGQYRIGKIELEGAELFEPDVLKKQIFLKSGDIAAQSALDAAAAAVRRYYGNRGYVRSWVVPVIQTNPDTLVADVTLQIQEGRLATIHKIDIRGNEKTKDEVIRRELAVFPGEKFHEQKVETSERRLKNLGYFESVDSSYVPAEGTNTYDLAFKVKEKAMGSFLIGAGFSSVDALVGFAELSHGNFDIKHWPPVGDGQKMKVRVQAGSSRNDVEVSFVEPWFLDRKLSLGVDLYHRTAEYYSDDYDLETTGARVSLSKPLGPFVRGTLSYSLENFDVQDITAPSNSFLATQAGSSLKSTVGATVSRDTRDQFFIPTRGNQSSISVEVAGGPLGGDVETVLTEAKTSQFWPLWNDHVLNVRGSLSSVDSYGDEEVPIFDRLYLGGPRTLRGFDYRDVSPRDPNNNNEPYGGRASWFASAEYTVPLWDKIRGAIFYDIGAVGEDPFEFFDPEINSCYGIGARFDLPMFPLRLDYAFPHLTDEYNENASPRWNFMLGYTF